MATSVQAPTFDAVESTCLSFDECVGNKGSDILQNLVQTLAPLSMSDPGVNQWGVTSIISYPLFGNADAEIYPHVASQYHAWPNAKCGIAMLSVDKFLYPWKQTRGNEFIPCSNDICNILKRFHNFKIPIVPLNWPKSL